MGKIIHIIQISFLIVALDVGNLLVQPSHLFFFEHTFVLNGDNLDEVLNDTLPVVEHTTCEGRTRVQVMLADEFEQFLARYTVFNETEFHHIHVAEIVEGVVWVVDVGNTTTHTGSEVTASLAKYNHTPASHILTTVITSALDDGYGSRVSDAKTLTDLSVDIQLSACSTVETSVSCDDIILCTEILTRTSWWQYADASAREALAEVVVALALELKVKTVYGKSTNRLACRSLELDVDGTVG